MMKQFWIGYWFKPGISIQNWLCHSYFWNRGYFKNHQYDGKENTFNTGIYMLNHQNAFLDPIVIAGRTKDYSFLSKGGTFKTYGC